MKLSKLEKLAIAVSKRFKDSKQELKIQTLAGELREAAATKGGHNPRQWNGRKAGEKRVKKTPYKWGTVGARIPGEYTLPSKYQQKKAVVVQFNKAEKYKAKINSRQWKKAAGGK